MFDGWSASRNVDPLSLPWDRYLNLVYYFMTRNLDTAEKDKIDAEMASIERALALEKVKKQPKQPKQVPATPMPQPSTGRRANLPPAPAGWGTTGVTTQDALLIRKTLSGGGRRLSAVDSA